MFYVTCGLEVYYSKNLLFTSFRNNQGDWSTEGCFVNETTTNYTTCHCYHLTNFAVLMSLTEKGTTVIIVRKYSNTVKPLYNGNHRDIRIVSIIERRSLRRGSSQIGLFCFKNLLLGVRV